MCRLGVNIDHVATLREVRHSIEPEPVFAALIAEASGADSIVAHLREDRRHIKETDIFLLKRVIRTKLNLEMSISFDIVNFACKVKPFRATLVPERRAELTTEGGLDIVANFKKIKPVVEKLKENGIEVSLFIDPEKKQIDASKKAGVDIIELHTGRYSNAVKEREVDKYFRQIKTAAIYARRSGFNVFAGHGLDYYNVMRIAKIKEIEELNIGYSIICRAVLVGLDRAVREMKALII
ncbi:MAG: pyridoxine 5'-phosphate synthase [Candidatus Omnitrophica bacterium]|nr:pyridoxine 5'-phosphate synthase [Candidatus Omnitrophota bacterium]